MSNRIEQAGRKRFGWIVSGKFLCGTWLAALVLIALPAAVQAQQDKTWDANGAVAGTGGTSTWNTSNLAWRDSVGLTVWDNSLLDSAIFGGTVGTVTLGGPITVRNITFTLGGYTVTGNTLTLAGLAPAVRLTAGTTTIASGIAGTAGLTTTGAGSLILSGIGSYSGGLTLTGTGTVSLTNSANTYTGATTIQSGTLQIGNGGATGSLGSTSQVVNNGTLTINRTGTVTIGQAISGTGNLTKLATGTAILTGGNTYTGLTSISAGILQIGNGGTTGTLGTGNVAVSGATTRLLINRSDTITIGQTISGTGGLTQAGTGTTILTGNNTYATTTISAGTLQVGAGGTTGSLGTSTVTVASGSTLAIDRSNTLTLTNVISGAGTLRQAGSGTTILLGKNTYSGGTTISAGTLQIGNGASNTFGQLGSGAVVNNGVLVFNRHGAENDGRTIANVISGTGTLVQNGPGTIWLTGTNTYTGPTIINLGTLSLGGGPLLPGATGDLGNSSQVINAGILQINRTNAITLAQAISGSGQLVKLAAGTATLTGTNTYAGATTITGGTLQIGDGGSTGTLGSGNVVMGAGTLLAVNRDNTYVVNNNISGDGALRQMGAGTTVLNGASTYTGATSVDAGTLLVNGTLASPSVTIAAGATLGGSGILAGAVIVGAGATIAPGAAAAGTLTVGMLTLNSGSLLDFELGTPNVVGGPNDLIAVGGDLTLAGTINITDAGNFASTPGSYRLFNYTGALTNNTLNVGSTPGYGPGEAVVQTVIPGKVNLIVSSGMNVAFWDGAGPQDDGSIDGGTQIWNNASGNWTNVDGGINQSWLNGMAIFEAGAGTVALGANVQARALQFSSTGYVINGGAFSIQMNELPSGAPPLVAVDPGVTATINAAITGTTGLNKAGTGTLILGGTNIYSGTTTIDGGILLVNGSLTSSPVVVNDGATLGGQGTILGAVTIDSGGTISPGNSPGTLTVGSLNLVSGSILNYELDTPGVIGGGVNDLIIVTGNLTLAGTLNVADLGGFGLGTYRLMNYGGALTNNGLLFGTLPDGFAYALQTNVAGQVNLAVGSTIPGPVQYWDGSNSVGNFVVDGGSGIWTAGSTNWTTSDGAFNQAWSGQTAVFSGTAGSVAVVGPIAFNSLRFETNGYVVVAGSGGVLTTNTPDSVVLLDPAVTATIGVPIAGSGGLDVQGAGTLVLSGTNSYAGGTLINAGVVSVSADANLGAASGALTLNGGTLQATADMASARPTTISVAFGTIETTSQSTFTLSGVVSGAGGLVKTGTGTLVLSGANTYAGGTLVGAGTLSISSDGNLGAASAQLVLDNGTLQTTASFASTRPTILGVNGGVFSTNGGTTFTVQGTVDGTGSLTKTGGGTLTLTGANTYSGGTRLDDGTLSISSDQNLGVSSGGLTFAGGTLRTTADVSSNRSVTLKSRGGIVETGDGTRFLLQSNVAGPGGLTKAGDGLLVLTGSNNYTGGTTIEAGVLQIGNCGTTGSIVGNVVNDGLLVFSRSDTSTYAGSISGAGGVIKNCMGTLTLRGTNTYSAGTLINTGTLVGDTGSLQGAILNNSALFFDQDDDGTFRGTISGSGTLDKTGSGAVLLTGDHGVQGPTTVQAGTLALDGSLLGPVRVLNGATFDATGTVGGPLTVDGTVTVRSSASGGFGLLGVREAVTFNAGSHYGIGIDPSGGNSALVTLGASTINGAIVDVNAQPGDYGRVTQYAILRADGGLNGTASASAATTFDPILTQDGTTLFLTLLRTDVPLQPFSSTASGWGIGGAIDSVKVDARGDLADVTRELTALDDAALGRALDGIAGEIHASATQLAAIDGESAMDVVRSEVGVRAWSRASDNAARAGSPSSPWGSSGRRAWVRLRSESASFDSDSSTDGEGGRPGAHGASLSLHGFALGLDWTLAPNWLLGVGGTYATGRLALDDLAERSEFSALRGLMYVGYGRPRWAISSGFGLGHLGYERTRAFSFMAFDPASQPLLGGVDRVATSSPSGAAVEFWTDGRLDVSMGAWDLQPTIGVRAARFGVGEWEETGAQALSLTAPSQANHSVQADGGVRLSRALGRFRPYVGGMYRREVSAGRMAATLQLGEGAGGLFEVDGLSLAKDVGVGQAGVILLGNEFSVVLGYEARRARQQTRHTLHLAVGFE